jgi:uncharacterized protein involved in exopolysaccharide biosynthesis/Mrp family chromosome partitioning ATPase
MAQYELNLQDYLRIIRKRSFIIIASMIIFALSAYKYVSAQIPVYQSTSTVKIEEHHAGAIAGSEWLNSTPGNLMETQTKVVKGFNVLKNAALKLGTINDKSNPAAIDEAVADLDGKVSAAQVGDTNLIAITAKTTNAHETMTIANSIANAYMENNLSEKNMQARTTRKFIEEQLASVKKRLIDAEEKLKRFHDHVDNMRAADEMLTKSADLEFQLASLTQKYTEKHPKVIQLRAQLNGIRERIKGISSREVEYAQLTREVEVNRKIYTMLREKLEEVRISEAEKVPDVSIIDPAILPDAPENGQSGLSMPLGAFLGLVIGLILAIVVETLDTSIGTIEDVESLVKLSVIGVIPSILSELPPEKNLFLRFKKSLLARWQTDEASERYIRLMVYYKPNSPISECFRNIRTNIMSKNPPKTIMVTSSNPKEGKTSTTINLGLTMSQEGQRTLLVSSDMRRPLIARTFGLPKNPGLSDILTGTATLDESVRGLSDMIMGELKMDDLIKSPAMKNLWILPSGNIPSYPAELLGSAEMDALIREMKGKFDVILFDAPPVLVVTDASVLAPKMDKIVLVYEIGKTSRHALSRTKSQLETMDGKIAGVILNHITPQTEIFKSYPYYYKYRYGYNKLEGT